MVYFNHKPLLEELPDTEGARVASDPEGAAGPGRPGELKSGPAQGAGLGGKGVRQGRTRRKSKNLIWEEER